MRISIATAAVLAMATFSGCLNLHREKTEGSEHAIASLLDRLDSIGFYKYTEPLRKDSIKKDAARSGYIFGADTGRTYACDAQELADWGFKDFIREITPFLQHQKIGPLDVIDDISSDCTYTAIINGKKYVIFRTKEVNPDNLQDLMNEQCFAVINSILIDAGSAERVYQLYSGTDQRAVFLTPEMFSLIRKSRALADRNLPIEIKVKPVK